MVGWYWLLVAFFLGCLSVALPILFIVLDAKNTAQAIEASYAGLYPPVDHSADSDNVTSQYDSTEGKQ